MLLGHTQLPYAVDAHAHVFDLARYPIHPSSGFALLPNEPGTAQQFRAVLEVHGFTHALLINPLGGYGIDNRNLLDILSESEGRFRGVCVIPHDIAETEVTRLVEAGVVGVRFNLSFASSPSLHGTGGQRLLSLARAHDLTVQIHYHVEDDILAAEPLLKAAGAAGTPVVFDHCGRPDPELGIEQPGFQALLRLGRSENCYVKLSGVFRSSKSGWPYRDMDPFIERLVEVFTLERCMWGSDWPFLRARTRIDYGPEVSCLTRWFPDAADRKKLLWDNPARLFGFAPPAQT